MITVIVPAHNEASVIERTLTALTRDASPGELDIIVVANGCTDETADRARGIDYPIRVIETEVGSKIHALNLGDQHARSFPRIYLDADVDLPTDDCRRLASALAPTGDLHLVSPRMDIDLEDRPWSVRAYYRIWTRLPYYRSKIGGVFAFSEEGRGRFDEWPDLIADDTFASTRVEPKEQAVIEGSRFRMSPPATLEALRRIEIRRRSGFSELAERYPDLMERRQRSQKTALLLLGFRPWLWPALGVYLWTKLQTRWEAARRIADGEGKAWLRDETTR
ncbi:MAG: glycosyltransferase [Planctomycetota bacterium]